ncbi:MAG: hypothetical protein GY898_27520 [Proteobacteria bacterium]|nr:hypothetical protein [Pseudomonadota bacterium]
MTRRWTKNPWRPAVLVAALALAAGCTPEEPVCDPSSDLDGDGVDDCAEEELGTNPEAADTDEDGFADAEELDCVSDPLDADEVCYACGWGHNDPGDLESDGAEIGDVIADGEIVDQCGEDLSVWDLHGEYHILFMTASW